MTIQTWSCLQPRIYERQPLERICSKKISSLAMRRALLRGELRYRAFLPVVAIALDLVQVVAEETKDDAGPFDGVGGVNIPPQIRLHHARRKAIEPFFLQCCDSRLGAVVRAFILGDFSDALVRAVYPPAGAVIVRLVTMTLFMDMAHLNEAMIR